VRDGSLYFVMRPLGPFEHAKEVRGRFLATEKLSSHLRVEAEVSESVARMEIRVAVENCIFEISLFFE